MTNYSENCDKTLVRAFPTLNANNIVKSWQIEVVYSYPTAGYATTNEPLRRKYQHIEKVEHLNKTINQFTKTELLAFFNNGQYDSIFDSTYESLFSPLKELKDTSFDIDTLAD